MGLSDWEATRVVGLTFHMKDEKPNKHFCLDDKPPHFHMEATGEPADKTMVL